jgi:hypothetical protein
MSTLGQKQPIHPVRPNVCFAPKAVIRKRYAQTSALRFYTPPQRAMDRLPFGTQPLLSTSSVTSRHTPSVLPVG